LVASLAEATAKHQIVLLTIATIKHRSTIKHRLTIKHRSSVNYQLSTVKKHQVPQALLPPWNRVNLIVLGYRPTAMLI
jgi:hypothetical protein